MKAVIVITDVDGDDDVDDVNVNLTFDGAGFNEKSAAHCLAAEMLTKVAERLGPKKGQK